MRQIQLSRAIVASGLMARDLHAGAFGYAAGMEHERFFVRLDGDPLYAPETSVPLGTMAEVAVRPELADLVEHVVLDAPKGENAAATRAWMAFFAARVARLGDLTLAADVRSSSVEDEFGCAAHRPVHW